MPEPNNVTQEVWTWMERPNATPDPGRPSGGVNHVGIKLDLPDPEPGMGYVDDDVVLFSGKGGERRGAGELAKARAQMAARAPTFYRLLEHVVMLGSAPADLELLIKLNLYRAAPGVYPKPEVPNPPRKSAWQKLLDDDFG